jgi:2-keto-4-pentenoate hydratase/2-oxohepta-3-ene-1,7-dioic acid hydratase in catechol pathway
VKLLRYEKDDAGARIGALVGGDLVLDLEAALGAEVTGPLPPAASLEWWDTAGRLWEPIRQALGELEKGAAALARAQRAGRAHALASVKLRAPVARPGKVICIGLNYRDHAVESKMPIPERPITFSKFPSCVVGPGDAVWLPSGSSQTDYEAELAVVIGRRARGVPRERAYAHVLGYCCFNDVSARDFQFADGQWQRGKSCDTFAPMGPFVVTTDEVPDPQALAIRLRLNGATMQDSRTDQLIFGVPELIEFLSAVITLEPGDVIATGTPPGVGFARKPPVYLRPGDRMEVEIEGLGVLANPVADAP